MDPNQPVFNISSDEEEPERPYHEGSKELPGDDTGFKDPDEVEFVREVKARNKSRPSKPKSKDVHDDDDCVVLEGDPDKPLEVAHGQDSSDELMVLGQKGEIACRDFPHARHLCANFKFSSTPHEKYCEQCHCFVCERRAPCEDWGSGTSSDDHCHATEKKERWNSLREKVRRLKNVPPVASPPIAAAAQFNNAPNNISRLTPQSTPQNQDTTPIAENQMLSNVQDQLARLQLENRVSRSNVQNQVYEQSIQNEFPRRRRRPRPRT